MSDLSVRLVLTLAGNLLAGLRRSGAGVRQFSVDGQRAMAVLSRSTDLAFRGIDRLGNRYTGLVTGAAGAATTRFLANQERRLTRLGIAANLGAQEVLNLRDEIYRAAQAPDVRIDPSQILAAIESIVEKTGDLGFARDNLRNIALAIQATGAEGVAIGELLGEFQKMGMQGDWRILQALDTLNVQGKTGAFTLQNLAALGPRVVTAYSAAVKGRRDGATVLREMGAALQVIRGGVGSAEMAATSFERLLAELQDAQKQKLFKKLGVEIFTVGKDGEKALRPINELMLQILAKTRGDRTALGGLFGDESIRAFNALTPERIESYMASVGRGEQTLQDSARAARDAAAGYTNLLTSLQRFGTITFGPDLARLAEVLNGVDPDAAQRWLQVATSVGIAVGALVAARKLFTMGQGIAGALGGLGKGKNSDGSPVAAGGLGSLADAAGVVRVFVVNMPGGLPGAGGLPEMPDGPGAESPDGKPASRAARLARIAGKALAVTGAGAMGWEIGSAISSAIEGSGISNAIGRAVALAIRPINDTARDAREQEIRSGLRPQQPAPAPDASSAISGPGGGSLRNDRRLETPGRSAPRTAPAPPPASGAGDSLDRGGEPVRAAVTIRIDQDGRARVGAVRAPTGVEVDVTTGHRAVGAQP